MENTMKFFTKYGTITTIFIVISLLIIFSLLYGYKDNKIVVSDSKSLNEGWVYTKTNEVINLPFDFHFPKNEVYSLSIILPDDFEHPQHILIRGSLQDVIVSLDGTNIYTFDLRNENKAMPYASLWHYVEIPAYSDGLELTVTLHSPFKAMSGLTNDIYYGSINDLNTHILFKYANKLILGLVTLTFGLLFSFLSLFVDKIKHNDVVYIGLFGIILSLWMISESRTLQLFISSHYIHGGLSYLMLALLPIPMFVYIKRHVLKRFNNIFLGFIIYFFLQFIAIVLLQLLGIAGYFETVIVVHASMIIGIGSVIGLLIYEIYHYPERKVAKRFLLYCSVLGILAVTEITYFALKEYDMITIYVQWISMLFIVLLFARYLYIINLNQKDRIENKVLAELALLDPLTKGKNRHAYEKDLDHIFNQANLRKTLRIIYFDFDDLKKINDTLGHIGGDNLLKDGYELIESSFGSLGSCYRIGGDEFSCLSTDVSNESYQECSMKFNKKLEQYNILKDSSMRISYGSALYDESVDHKPSDLIRRADEKMYQEKNKSLKA